MFLYRNCHLQHLQRSAPSHLRQNAPSLPSVGHADVARGHRRCLSQTDWPALPRLPFLNVTMPPAMLPFLVQSNPNGESTNTSLVPCLPVSRNRSSSHIPPISASVANSANLI